MGCGAAKEEKKEEQKPAKQAAATAETKPAAVAAPAAVPTPRGARWVDVGAGNGGPWDMGNEQARGMAEEEGFTLKRPNDVIVQDLFVDPAAEIEYAEGTGPSLETYEDEDGNPVEEEVPGKEDSYTELKKALHRWSSMFLQTQCMARYDPAGWADDKVDFVVPDACKEHDLTQWGVEEWKAAMVADGYDVSGIKKAGDDGGDLRPQDFLDGNIVDRDGNEFEKFQLSMGDPLNSFVCQKCFGLGVHISRYRKEYEAEHPKRQQ